MVQEEKETLSSRGSCYSLSSQAESTTVIVCVINIERDYL